LFTITTGDVEVKNAWVYFAAPLLLQREKEKEDEVPNLKLL
jgi:hypothetical protein